MNTQQMTLTNTRDTHIYQYVRELSNVLVGRPGASCEKLSRIVERIERAGLRESHVTSSPSWCCHDDDDDDIAKSIGIIPDL